MPTEAWFRNPHTYIRELVEVGVGRIAWDRGFIHKKRIDPAKHANLYFPASIPYRVLLVGDQGTAEYRRGDTKPSAVYPTWCYGEDFSLLEELVAENAADDEDITGDMSVPDDERPVLGQEHRVVVSDLPMGHTGPGRRFLRQLQELQHENPDCIIHVHGLYSFRLAFGMGFRAADVEVRTTAQKGRVYLPNGKEMKYEQTVAAPHWITLLGMSPVDLEVPRNRCMYNIRSAVWAGEHYEENIKFKAKGPHEPDTTSPSAVPATTSRVHSGVVRPGDKFLCDTCSLQTSCKYVRSGGVCSIPDSEPAQLARFFNTRDSDMIITGLGTLLAAQTNRLERGMEDEEDMGELDPEVTKIINSLFANGVKLAKLVNPTLAGGPKVGVFVNGATDTRVSVAGMSPKALVAGIVNELEGRGISRDKITPEMIQGLIEGPSRETIDATVIAESA